MHDRNLNYKKNLPVQDKKNIKITVNDKELLVKNGDTLSSHAYTTVALYSGNVRNLLPVNLADLDYQTSKFFFNVDDSYKIEIYFFKKIVPITLPPAINYNLINFLKLYVPKEKPNYCCISFAYEMMYGRGFIKNDNNSNYFDYKFSEVFNQNKLITGDIVCLYKKKNNLIATYASLEHFAMYVGENYYLSLYGSHGPLIMTTLHSMSQAWETDSCCKVVKKSKVSSSTCSNLNNFLSFAAQKGIYKNCFFAITVTSAAAIVATKIYNNFVYNPT